MVKLPQSNEMSALIFQPSLVRRPTVASMLITLIVSWLGLNIKISFPSDEVGAERSFFDSNFEIGKKIHSHFHRSRFLTEDSRKFRPFFFFLILVWN